MLNSLPDHYLAGGFSHPFEKYAQSSNWIIFPGTFPETKIAPENRPLEKEIQIGNYNFQGLC